MERKNLLPTALQKDEDTIRSQQQLELSEQEDRRRSSLFAAAYLDLGKEKNPRRNSRKDRRSLGSLAAAYADGVSAGQNGGDPVGLSDEEEQKEQVRERKESRADGSPNGNISFRTSEEELLDKDSDFDTDLEDNGENRTNHSA